MLFPTTWMAIPFTKFGIPPSLVGNFSCQWLFRVRWQSDMLTCIVVSLYQQCDSNIVSWYCVWTRVYLSKCRVLWQSECVARRPPGAGVGTISGRCCHIVVLMWITILDIPFGMVPTSRTLRSFRYSRTCNSVRDVLKHRRCSDCWLEKWIKCWQLANSVLGFVKQWFLNLFFSSPSWCSEHHRPILGHTQEYSLVLRGFVRSEMGKMRKVNGKCKVVPMHATK